MKFDRMLPEIRLMRRTKQIKMYTIIRMLYIIESGGNWKAVNEFYKVSNQTYQFLFWMVTENLNRKNKAKQIVIPIKNIKQPYWKDEEEMIIQEYRIEDLEGDELEIYRSSFISTVQHNSKREPVEYS